ncbi:ribbon-helix-helix domain-containing protein [Thermodesulfobacteriota bacterium]
MIHTQKAQKVAISMPEILIKEIDALSKKRGLSRSRYITQAVREKVIAEQKLFITECYNKIFSDVNIQKEQLEISKCFEGAGIEGGQEW